jgi:hypothetical protein
MLDVRTPRVAAVADEPLRNDRAVRLLPVPEVADDRARPVDVCETRATGPALLVERAARSLGRAALEPFEERRDDFGDDLPRGLFGRFGHGRALGDEIGDEMNVRLDRAEKFRLEQHLLQTEAVESVALHYLHNAGGKELPDVTEPARAFGEEPPRPPRRPLAREPAASTS